MKKFISIFLLTALTLGTVSCRENRQPYHNVVYNAQGEQMVQVQDYDQNGNLITYFIAYSLFNRLYNSGGYGAVNKYYYGNRAYFDRSYATYDRDYSYDSNPRYVNTKTYRNSAPKPITTYNTRPSSTYRPSAPTTTTYKPTTYRSSAPTTTTYRSSAPTTTYKSSSTYRSSSPSSSSYHSSSPSSSSSYRSSAPSSSYRSSAPSSSSFRSSSSSSYRSSSSSFRSSSPRH
jgi:hypothetical protein